GVPRPANPARQTFRSVSARLGVRCPRRGARGRPQGLQFCRAGFAGRGTALARSTDATRSRPFPFPTRDKVSGRSPEHRLHLLEEALRQRVHLLARDAGVRAGLALAAQLESRAAVDAGRNLDAELVRPPLHAGALAAGARVRDDRALPVAVAARLGDREEALLEAHLPRAAALRTGARR